MDASLNLSTNQEYISLISELKQRIYHGQTRAALAVNSELIKLYWEIGSIIILKQKEKNWGSKFIECLSKDLLKLFPNIKGFSVSNLKYMSQFASEYPQFKIGQQPVGQLPWSHNIILIQKVKDKEERLWYFQNSLEQRWSRASLIHQIETNLYHRQKTNKKASNFKDRLSPEQSELVEKTLKDPYIFDFLAVGKDAHEREIEKELTQHVQQFLLELGAGFAFVGKQYHLEVAKEDFYIDLLFYHLKLRCYVIIELKTTKFKPEDAGKLNFYLSAVDDLVRHPEDNPSIGLILCKDNKKTLAEYALKDMSKPMGISAYEIIESLPEELATDLPTVEQIEAELNGDYS